MENDKEYALDQREIEGVFARLGLSGYADRVRFAEPAGAARASGYDVVFSSTSNPFAA
ncbi:hypothetical protein ACX80W_01775 [Arthrobacter sp. TMN-37]